MKTSRVTTPKGNNSPNPIPNALVAGARSSGLLIGVAVVTTGANTFDN